MDGNDFSTAHIEASLTQAQEFYGNHGHSVIQIGKPFVARHKLTGDREYIIQGFDMAEFPCAIELQNVDTLEKFTVEAKWFDERRIIQ